MVEFHSRSVPKRSNARVVTGPAKNIGRGGMSYKFTIDSDPQTAAEPRTTPRRLMLDAAPIPIGPALHYLVRVTHSGKVGQSFKGQNDEIMTLMDGDRFVSVYTGPCTNG